MKYIFMIILCLGLFGCMSLDQEQAIRNKIIQDESANSTICIDGVKYFAIYVRPKYSAGQYIFTPKFNKNGTIETCNE